MGAAEGRPESSNSASTDGKQAESSSSAGEIITVVPASTQVSTENAEQHQQHPLLRALESIPNISPLLKQSVEKSWKDAFTRNDSKDRPGEVTEAFAKLISDYEKMLQTSADAVCARQKEVSKKILGTDLKATSAYQALYSRTNDLRRLSGSSRDIEKLQRQLEDCKLALNKALQTSDSVREALIAIDPTLESTFGEKVEDVIERMKAQAVTEGLRQTPDEKSPITELVSSNTLDFTPPSSPPQPSSTPSPSLQLSGLMRKMMPKSIITGMNNNSSEAKGLSGGSTHSNNSTTTTTTTDLKPFTKSLSKVFFRMGRGGSSKDINKDAEVVGGAIVRGEEEGAPSSISVKDRQEDTDVQMLTDVNKEIA
mmetsp:Transcript_5384/g.8359  ORF Transcript_5384/g.8359 Transcript_5384/m.8359 type:complete len:368 (+) Transcript_5384:88-1191(+)